MKGKQTELDLWIDGTIATNLLVDWSQRSYRKERVHRKQKWEKVGGRLLTRKKKRWAWKGKFRSCATTRRWARRRRTFGRKLKTSLSWWIPGQGITLSMEQHRRDELCHTSKFTLRSFGLLRLPGRTRRTALTILAAIATTLSATEHTAFIKFQP